MKTAAIVFFPLILAGTTGCILDIHKGPMELHDGETGDTPIESVDVAFDDSIPSYCGNGRKEGIEECDDGNNLPGDGCGSDCRVEPYMCGNDVCEPEIGESCNNCEEDCPDCECTTDGDCPMGQNCVNMVCRIPCERNDDCPDGMVCIWDLCILDDIDALCGNGLDDDRDGYVDCDDTDCRLNGCVKVCLREADGEMCNDGIDNDGNGFSDCDDFSCLFNLNVNFCTCDGGPECGSAKCSNGEDDDGDTLVDCEDSDCMRDPHVSECNAENTGLICTDGVDNDGNGKGDCDDDICRSTASVDKCCKPVGG